MSPILRNLLSVVRRFRLAAILNVLGLSVAFAAFMVILMQWDFDYNFDRFHKDSDRIFRLELVAGTSVEATVSRPLAERFFESSPHILVGALSNTRDGDAFFQVENKGVRNYYEEKAKTVTHGYTEVFDFQFTEGQDDALKTPGKVIIPYSLSQRLFGNESAVGRQLTGDWGVSTVGAVYRDFPANTILKNCIYFPMSDDENKQNWESNRYHVYLRVNQASDVALLFDNFKRGFDGKAAFGADFEWDDSGAGLRLTALPDVHFDTDIQYDDTPKASRQIIWVLLTIGAVIILIAAINFTNFNTALTPMRVKNINTQRVLGARQRTLRFALVFEAVVFCFVACIVALVLVFAFRESPLARLVDADLSLTAHPLIMCTTVVVALLAGTLAGFYPARYMTSFAPALVLKGSFGLSPKGRKMRNALISIQYISSFVLIIGASFMYLQNRFMQQSPLGYDKDGLITVNLYRIQGNRDAFNNTLKAFSGIEDVTYGRFILSSEDQYAGWTRTYKGENIQFQCLPVHYSFLNVMGVDITEGRGFRQEDTATPHGAYVFNEAARKKFGLELNTTIDNNGEIIGFMPDVKFASFRTAVDPMAFYVWGASSSGSQPNNAYIKLKAGTDLRAAMSHVRTTLATFDADYLYNVRFYDEVLQQLYEKETSLSSLISLFSLIAIFISIVGVFGLVVFDSECRRKEIGIRKVLGASTVGIIVMFNKTYFRIITICFVIAAPLAWYAVSRWLQHFAYRTPMYWWVYLLAFAAITAITITTVTFQNWRVAGDNPVEAIKIE